MAQIQIGNYGKFLKYSRSEYFQIKFQIKGEKKKIVNEFKVTYDGWKKGKSQRREVGKKMGKKKRKGNEKNYNTRGGTIYEAPAIR